jgi:hypothetical protein
MTIDAIHLAHSTFRAGFGNKSVCPMPIDHGQNVPSTIHPAAARTHNITWRWSSAAI